MITVYGTERDAVPCHAICGTPATASEKCAACRLSEPAARSCMQLLLNSMHLAKQYKATQSRQNKAVLLATLATIITIMIIFAEGGGIVVSRSQTTSRFSMVHTGNSCSIMRIPNLNG